MSSLLLYALVAPAQVDAGSLPPGLAGGRLRLQTMHGLTAVLETVPAAPTHSADELRGYDRVVRHLAAAWPAVLPFRFGQVVASEHALEVELTRRAAELGRRLERVRDCLQWTVRVYGPQPEAEEVGDAGPGTRHLEARRSILHAPAVRAMRARFVEGAREEIVAPGRSPLLASLYYLVRDADHSAWNQIVAETKRRCAELRCAVSGPWPPYAFAAEFL